MIGNVQICTRLATHDDVGTLLEGARRAVAYGISTSLELPVLQPPTVRERAISQAHEGAFVNLQRWMKEMTEKKNWMVCRNLQLCDFSVTGRGIRALKCFKPGDCVVSTPYRLLITPEIVLGHVIGLRLKEHGKIFTPQQVLTLFLAIESIKGSSSKWFPYINTLPSVYSTPLYFLSCEMNLLTPRAKQMAETLRTRFSAACEDMTSFIREAFPSMFSVVSQDILKWAWSTVDTRSVYLETKPHELLDLKPEESNVALAPFLDMLNHSDTAQITAGLNPVNNCYEITTENKCEKYDQLFISYGPHDNTKLLVNYGFTLPQNLNNCYILSTDDVRRCFPRTDHWDRKLSLLHDCQIHKSSWKKLLQGMSISDENDVSACEMARTLVQEALWKATRHAKSVRNRPTTLHTNLILNLAVDDISILEHSLKTLNQR